jgi:hypothetical protein
MNEQRRSKRKQIEAFIQIVNAMTGEVIGRISNLSVDGLMIMSSVVPVEDGLYQFAFHLPDGNGRGAALEVGVHEQWHEPANAPGQYWAGFRIIDIAPRDFEALQTYVHNDSL